MNATYDELKELRREQRTMRESPLAFKYEPLFRRLSELQYKVMWNCYIKGLSYADCGLIVHYSERQVKRIVRQSVESLEKMERGS